MPHSNSAQDASNKTHDQEEAALTDGLKNKEQAATLKSATPLKKGELNENDIYEFLPAALEVEQTPASPIGQAIIWAIALLFIIALGWGLVGKIDIVAVAAGKVITSERVKQIQPLETSTITAIHIQEGDYVEKGQALIDLDNTLYSADVERLRTELQLRQLESHRMASYDQWLSNGLSTTPALEAELTNNPQTNQALLIKQQQLLNQQVAETRSRLAGLSSEQARLRAEQDMTRAEIAKQEQIVPILQQRVDALDSLQQQELGSRLQFLELKQELIEEQQDQQVQQARLKQLDASIEATTAQIETLKYEQAKNNLIDKEQTDMQVAGLQQESIKARQRLSQQSITAPIDGQVQQLAVHTVGGVVTPAQVMMLIVPRQSQLEVEAMVLNKDIGFVEEGQKVAIKIDTFNFTKYGMLEGEIINLSDDAIQDENLGLVYGIRVRLDEDKLQVENKWVRLSPGMSVTAEVKTGQRRLIEYFLSPLLRYRQESIRER